MINKAFRILPSSFSIVKFASFNQKKFQGIIIIIKRVKYYENDVILHNEKFTIFFRTTKFQKKEQSK